MMVSQGFLSAELGIFDNRRYSYVSKVVCVGTKLDESRPEAVPKISRGVLGWTGIPGPGSKEVCAWSLPSLIGWSVPVITI